MHPVASHYTEPDLLDAILAALREQGKDLNNLSPDDLAGVDEFHIRGREATVELAEMAQIQDHWQVLDLGSGLGGSTRFLAHNYCCEVIGIDLTPEYVALATALSGKVGLSDRTEFQQANATATDFPSGHFDLVWTQHVTMNIEDKPALYREVFRVLKPGGRFVFHDIVEGNGEPLPFPVHWASDASTSFLIPPSRMRSALEDTGLLTVEWRDVTDVSRDWYLAKVAEAQRGGGSPLGLHLLLGESRMEKIQNVAKAAVDGRLAVVMALLEKPSEA